MYKILNFLIDIIEKIIKIFRLPQDATRLLGLKYAFVSIHDSDNVFIRKQKGQKS